MTLDVLKINWRATLAASAIFLAAIPCSIYAQPTNSHNGVLPGPNDAKITLVTATLLEDFHYSQQQFDRSVSEKFFDEYLSTLDPRRENFLQSDIDSFAHYRTNLDIYTINGHGDLRPAYDIFNRFKLRLAQHTAYVDDLLAHDKLKFDNADRIMVDRRKAAWPKNEDELKQLWRDRARFEFLQEKLDHEISSAAATYTNWETLSPQIFLQTNFLSKSNLTDIATQMRKHYDWTLRELTNWDSDSILSAYLNAMVHAYDPHSDYLNDEHAQSFSIELSLSLFGIGAQLTEQDGYCVVDSLVAGGPAEKSNQIHQHDKIIGVAQSNQPPVNVVDMDLGHVVTMIRGDKGTQVRLTIIPADDPTARRIVTLTRDEIKLQDQKAKAKLVEFADGKGATNRIGIVDVPSFYATIPLNGNENHDATNFVSDDVKILLERLEKENVGGIILDLRGDPGGSLEEAVKFTGLFIKQGPVVLARAADKSIATHSDDDTNIIYGGPLVVLANRFSASASEIVAGALQDYGRAIIVGDTSTFGKGTVQQLAPLRPFIWPATPTATNDPGTLKITISKFYRVSGASTQFKGVASDIVLPDLLNHSSEIGETALDYPLPFDTISGDDYTKLNLAYDKLNLVRPYLSELWLHSEARVATNQDFNYLRQDIAEFKKLQTDKTAPLNEIEALKERQQNAIKNKARDAERSARPIPNVKIYDITVANAATNLPPPEILSATNFPASALANPNQSLTNTIPKLDAERWKDAGMPQPIKISNIAPVDPTLDEAEHILQDYITLLSATNHVLIANHL